MPPNRNHIVRIGATQKPTFEGGLELWEVSLVSARFSDSSLARTALQASPHTSCLLTPRSNLKGEVQLSPPFYK